MSGGNDSDDWPDVPMTGVEGDRMVALNEYWVAVWPAKAAIRKVSAQARLTFFR